MDGKESRVEHELPLCQRSSPFALHVAPCLPIPIWTVIFLGCHCTSPPTSGSIFFFHSYLPYPSYVHTSLFYYPIPFSCSISHLSLQELIYFCQSLSPSISLLAYSAISPSLP